MEAKPLKIVPSSHNTSGGGSGLQKKIDMRHRKECDSVVDEKRKKFENVVMKEDKLDNFSSSSSFSNVFQEIRRVVITEAQRRELDFQVYIFNLLVRNIPVLDHLLQFYTTMEVPEPYRCRRTDGKKWHCGKMVVPDQNYCERHIHRGRNNCSTKPMETSQVTSPNPSSQTKTKLASKTELTISNPNLSRILYNVNTSYANNSLKNNIGTSKYRAAFSSAPMQSYGSNFVTFSNVTCVASDNRSCINLCKNDNNNKSIINRCGGKESIACDSNRISPGIGFSPRIFLQGSGCHPSYINHINNTKPELESSRCRRTDGKKWRCKHTVLPGQKYCATHMHRGAKKRLANCEPATTATTTSTTTSVVTNAQFLNSSTGTKLQEANCAIPNTNLSISLSPPSAPQFKKCSDEKSPSSCNSETTISDPINTISEGSYAFF